MRETKRKRLDALRSTDGSVGVVIMYGINSLAGALSNSMSTPPLD
jgi:hypothetical protein